MATHASTRTTPLYDRRKRKTQPRRGETDQGVRANQMSISTKPVSQITEADLLALITDKEAEGKTIDYKRDQVGRTDGDRREFLYDVTSFANSAGGDIVFGMDEDQGLPTNLCGLAGVNPDEEIGRLEQIARDGVRPPIVGIQSVAVTLASGHIAIVLRIPKSWNPPHQVTFQKAFRFYGRDTNSKYQLDVDELRSMYSLSESVAEKVRLFKVDRVAQIVAGQAPTALGPGAKMITHILPLSSFAGNGNLDLVPLWRDPTQLVRINRGGGSTRFNVDGLLVSTPQGQHRACYVQLYRNGRIEAVQYFSDEFTKRTSLPSTWFEKTVVFQFTGAQQLFEYVGIQPPVVLLLSMTGMQGWHMGVSPEYMTNAEDVFDRDPLFIPETVIDAFGGDFASKVRPVIDATWNAAGWPGSVNYDQNGKWNPPR
jgi:hypothetical protein